MFKKFLFSAVLSGIASLNAANLNVQFNNSTSVIYPTNLLQNNITAGANVTITPDSSGRIAISSSGSGGGGIVGTVVNPGTIASNNVPMLSANTNIVTSPINITGGSNATVTGNIIASGATIGSGSGLLKTTSGVVSQTDLTGDVTTSGGVATTLANSGVAPASYGGSSSIPSFTVDAKGRITTATGNAVSYTQATGLGLTNISSILSNNIIAGGNITITAGANGQLSIAATGGGGTPVTGTMVANGGSYAVGTVPIAFDTTGTNYVTSSLAISGTNASLTGKLTANGGAFTNTLTLNGNTVLTNELGGGNVYNTSVPVVGNLAVFRDTTGTNIVPSTNIAILNFLSGGSILSVPWLDTTTIGNTNTSVSISVRNPVRFIDYGAVGTPAWVTHGYLINPIAFSGGSTNTTISFADSLERSDNTGSTANGTFTLPAAIAGMTYTFTVTDADGINIRAVGDDVIIVGITVTSAAAFIGSTTIGSTITLTAHNSTQWIAESMTGTWTYNGTTLATFSALTGDVTTSGVVATLANTAVTAGVYGNASYIPQITVDAKGRLTLVTTNAAAGGGGGIGTNTLTTSTTAVAVTGASEETLATYTIPASTMAVNGDTIAFWSGMKFTNSINNKRIKVKFGGTTIFDSGSLAVTAATDIGITARIIRAGATTQKAIVEMNTSSLATFPAFAQVSAPAETLSGTVALVITGQGGAANDVTFDSWQVSLNPGTALGAGWLTGNTTFSTLSISSGHISPVGTQPAGMAGSIKYRTSMTSNIIVDNPSGTPVDGAQIIFELIQDGTGGWQVTSWDTKWSFSTDLPSAVVTAYDTANKVALVTAIYNSTADKWRVYGYLKGF